MYIVIDNYDSFTYNIVQYLSELTEKEIKVLRNDAVTVAELEAMKPEGILLGPGPGRPEESGITVEVLQKLSGKIPIMGICLGHQAIGYAFGAPIIGAKEIVHGKVHPMTHDGRGLFRGVPNPSNFTRYHSLVIDPQNLPADLEATAWSPDGEIMGVRHKTFPVEGVQFHPESIASEGGKRILANFLRWRREAFPFRSYLTRILRKLDLTRNESESLMDELTEGLLTPAQISGILISLAAKGPKSQEIAGCVTALRKKQRPLPYEGETLDTCGTGGDELGTFNVSSMTALLTAACGVPTAKHGNRAVSSKSGSAEFYQALGIEIDLEPEQAAELLRRTGFAFLFAPKYHSAMRHAAGVRKELGIKTIMNLLGPLANPAGAAFQVIGVYDDNLVPVITEAALMLGVKKVLGVYGTDGQDEISVCSSTNLYLGGEGEIKRQIIQPEDLGLNTYLISEMLGGTAVENARLAHDLLEGKGRPALRDAVLANTGAGLWVSGRADSLKEGVAQAREVWESGKLARKIEEVISVAKALKAGSL